MQITGSHVNFTSDISKFYFAAVSMAKMSSERFIEKLAFDGLFSSKLTRSVETTLAKWLLEFLGIPRKILGIPRNS